MASGLQITRHDDVLVIRFQDRQLSGNLPEELGGELYGVAAQEDCTKVLVNFSGVEFLASDMLGKLVVLNKKLRQKGGKMALCEVCPHIRQILVTTKLDALMTVKATEADGLSSLA